MNTTLAMGFCGRRSRRDSPFRLGSVPTEQPKNEHSSEGCSSDTRGTRGIQSAGGVDETLLDKWLATPEFEEQVVRQSSVALLNLPSK